MHFKVYLLLLFFIRYSDAFNITTILSQHPSFSTFSRYISQTQLASEINSCRVITVFAVPNDVVSSLSGKPLDVLKNLLRVHIVLGYYDVGKLRNLPNGSVEMTTLFQTTGRAVEQQGFLKATVLKTGKVVIRSATQTWGATLVRSVAAEACNFLVVSISNVIVPMGMDCGVLDSNSTSPVHAPWPARSPKMSLVPAPWPAHGQKMSPVPAPGPKMVPPRAPRESPPPGGLESPANAPAASRESPPNRIGTPTGLPPAGPPPTPADSGGSKTSDDRGHTWMMGVIQVLGLSLVLL